MSEQTWGDVENEYKVAEEIAKRYDIEIVIDVVPGESDWIHLLDFAKTVASLERELAEWRRKYEACKGTCSWNLISEDEDIWETGCGNAWYLTEGNIEENGMKYCPFCGGKLETNNA